MPGMLRVGNTVPADLCGQEVYFFCFFIKKHQYHLKTTCFRGIIYVVKLFNKLVAADCSGLSSVTSAVFRPVNLKEETMKKRLFTAALALVLSIGGVVLSAQEESHKLLFHNNAMKLVVSPRKTSETPAADLTQGLSLLSGSNSEVGPFGYKLNDGEFCSLGTKMSDSSNVDSTANTALISLGKFDKESVNTYQFGFKTEEGFSAFGPALKVVNKSTFDVESDPGFFMDSDPDSFYQLDFPKEPFDGKIEIYVMGEPLPPPNVTILIALAAAGGFLLYRNRKARARLSSAQV